MRAAPREVAATSVSCVCGRGHVSEELPLGLGAWREPSASQVEGGALARQAAAQDGRIESTVGVGVWRLARDRECDCVSRRVADRHMVCVVAERDP